jgi:hypothetical protein
MKHNLLTLVLALVAQVALADAPKPPMVKIVYRTMAPEVPADSFGAKPKTVYIAGDTYSRLEEEPDPEQHIHGLIITSEPDCWMINLFGRRGQHIVDPGPTFVTHQMILFDREAPEEFSRFEFGNELEFFNKHYAAPLEAKVIDGQRCDASEYRQSPYRIVLYVRPDTHTPFQIDIFKDNKIKFSVRYLSYETGIPYIAALFQPPPDVAMTEGKPGFTFFPK